MLIKGYVEELIGNEKNGVTYWRIKVDNTKYGTGSKKPKCNQGDYVQFEASANGNFWNCDVKTLQPASAPAVTNNATALQGQAATNAATASASVGATRPWVPDDKRQDAISYQSARKDALEITSILAANGALDFGKAKPNDKYELISAIVDKLTVRFFNDTKRLAPPTVTVGTSSSEPREAGDDLDDVPFT